MSKVGSGYKKIESIGSIPVEWDIKKICNIAAVTKLAGFEFTEYMSYIDDGEIIAIRALNLKKGKLDLTNIKKISKEVSDNLERSKLFNGDIVFSYVGTIGEVALIDEDDRYHLAPNVAKITFKDVDINFYLQYFRSDFIKKEINKLLTKSSQPALSMSNIREINVIVPSNKEQRAIAEILSTWDSAIENQEQLIEKKKEFKKGLMQSLLSGKVRFKEFDDKWSKKTLEQYITPVIRECDKPNEGYWRLGLRSHGKGTFHQFVKDPATVAMDKLYEVKPNDLIVNITFAWEHAIAIATSEDEGMLVSHRFPTYEFKENAHSMYFKYYVLQTKFKNMLVNISPGGAGRNRVMNKKDFLKLEVRVPSYEEQEKIAEVLITSDKEIELLQKELEALKLQKKGLMQRLLTGEVRVKV